MTPGRELDALVAEKVMGCTPKRDGSGRIECGCPDKGHEHFIDPYDREMDMGLKSYSTDIAAAWEVVDKIANHWSNVSLLRADDGSWHVCSDPEMSFGSSGAEAPTAPHAICLAALKAVGG